jgi:hypothetical protein
VLISSTNFGGYYTEEGGGFPGEVGPIYVEGATPDDMLVVRIHSVVPNHDLAAARLYTDFGGLSNEQGTRMLNPPIPERRYVWRIDRERMTATTELQGSAMQEIEIDLRPMLGRIAVAPRGEESYIALAPGYWGGNMDAPEVRAGTTVYLPVFHDGAYLYFGDGHARQGDGEVAGTGLETSMDVVLEIDVVRGKTIEGLRLRSVRRLRPARPACGEPGSEYRRSSVHGGGEVPETVSAAVALVREGHTARRFPCATALRTVMSITALILIGHVLAVPSPVPQAPDSFLVSSPDGAVAATVATGPELTFAITLDGRPVVHSSPISLTTAGGTVIGPDAIARDVGRRSVDTILRPVVPEKTSRVRDRFNELSVALDSVWTLDVRAYDNGVAYRFRTAQLGAIVVRRRSSRHDSSRRPTCGSRPRRASSRIPSADMTHCSSVRSPPRGWRASPCCLRCPRAPKSPSPNPICVTIPGCT